MKGTVYINFDLETYVPKSDRNNTKWHMEGNPKVDEHYLLGGTFSAQNPNKPDLEDKEKYFTFWVWKEEEFDTEKLEYAEKIILQKYTSLYLKN